MAHEPAPKNRPDAVAELLTQLPGLLAAGPPASRYLIAYSSGADSSALLHALSRLPLQTPLQAIHVQHGLHEDAEHWAEIAQHNCRAWQIPLQIERVKVTATGQGLEAAARDARYAAIQRHVQTGTVVLTAQHADDQAETLLLNLLRGSGIRGLAGIPPQRTLGRAMLYRPLLSLPGQLLRDYCQQQRLDYIDDSSNHELTFERNWLRHVLLPLLQSRFPHAGDKLAVSAGLLRQALPLYNQQLRRLLEPLYGPGQSLDIAGLQQHPEFVQHELLQAYLTELGIPLPSSRQSAELLRQLREARVDRNPELDWHDHRLQVYRARLYYRRHQPTTVFPDSVWQPDQPWHWPRVGTLSITGNPAAATRQWPRFQLRQRHGGETIVLADGRRHRLKQLCQQAGIPPWQRAHLPLAYHRGQLMAVADHWLHPALRRWLQQRGLRWQWQPVRYTHECNNR